MFSSFLQLLTLTRTTYLVACTLRVAASSCNQIKPVVSPGWQQWQVPTHPNAIQELENTVNAFTPISRNIGLPVSDLGPGIKRTRSNVSQNSNGSLSRHWPGLSSRWPMPNQCCHWMSAGGMGAASSTQPSSRSVFFFLIRSFTLGKIGLYTHLWVWVKVKD